MIEGLILDCGPPEEIGKTVHEIAIRSVRSLQLTWHQAYPYSLGNNVIHLRLILETAGFPIMHPQVLEKLRMRLTRLKY